MADGFSTYLADLLLGYFHGTNITALSTVYVQLHTGAPGAAGTANLSAVTTREGVTFAAPSAGSVSSSSEPSWTMTATETITDISLWDEATGGNFLDSIQLTSSRSVVATDTLQLTSAEIGFTPIAA